MKPRVVLSIGILTVVLMPAQLPAQSREKCYEISEDGKFQFTYWKRGGGAERVVHPITLRTFYLETLRQGQIPAEMSYGSFIALSKEQQQAMLETSQQEVIALIKGMPKDALKEPELESVSVMQQPITNISIVTETPSGEDCEEELQPADTMQPQKERREIPWIVKAVVQPGIVHELPDDNVASSASKPTESLEETKEIPWIVRAIIMHDHPMDLEQFETKSEPVLSWEESSKRERIYTLLNDLLAYQDDETQREYGKVFPGMNGRLYGTSDAELNEILTELLRMKDDFRADLNPELDKIFSELEALASGR